MNLQVLRLFQCLQTTLVAYEYGWVNTSDHPRTFPPKGCHERMGALLDHG